MPTTVSDALYQATLARMNVNWTPDEQFAADVRNAIEEAQELLRDHAGNAGLSFETGELRGLCVDCAWYLVYHKRAEFLREYGPELTNLRLREGFGCGKNDENAV